MSLIDWMEEFPALISVCDREGTILAMNAREAEFFKDQGGKDLIGSNLYDCHQPASMNMIEKLMEKQETRIYTAEEDGQTELIIQGPWYQNGQFMGLVELAIPLSGPIPHIKR